MTAYADLNVLTLRKRLLWDAKLAVYLEEWRGRPFVWGASDCGQFVAGALAVMTGMQRSRILAGVRHYSNERGAIRAAMGIGGPKRMEGRLRDFGLADVEGGLAFAQRGDIVVADRGQTLDALGVIWAGSVWTTHPGHVCAPYPIAEMLPDAIALRVP